MNTYYLVTALVLTFSLFLTGLEPCITIENTLLAFLTLLAKVNCQIEIMWGGGLAKGCSVWILSSGCEGQAGTTRGKDKRCGKDRGETVSFLPVVEIDFGDCNSITQDKGGAEIKHDVNIKINKLSWAEPNSSFPSILLAQQNYVFKLFCPTKMWV